MFYIINTSRLTFTVQPTDFVAGGQMGSTVVITIVDSHGNVITSNEKPVKLSVVNGLGVVVKTIKLKAVNGIATYSGFSTTKSGLYSLKPSQAGLTTTTSATFAVTAGPAVKAQFNVQPGTTAAGSKFIAEVFLLDRYGNLCTSDNSTVSLSLGEAPAAQRSGARWRFRWRGGSRCLMIWFSRPVENIGCWQATPPFRLYCRSGSSSSDQFVRFTA